MKKNLLYFSAMAVCVAFGSSCDSPKEKEATAPGYVIDMEIANTSMDSAFLFSLGTDGWDLLDSVKGDSGHFHFEGKVSGASYIAIGDRSRSYSVRFLADNNPITILANFEEPGNETITGSHTHDEHMATQDSMAIFDNYMESLISNYNAAEEVNDTAAMESIQKEYYSYSDLKDIWLKDWVKANPASFVAQFYVVNPLSYQLDATELAELVNGMAPEVQQSTMYETLSSKLAILENSAVGQIAPDFTMNDSTGTPQTLSAHFGSYLLIDFWASWCGPCRVENPQMVEIYHTYHAKGYNVLGVSLDSKRANWLKAITKDKLTWDHVSDLEGWSNAAAKLYGVSSIPHTVLLDPQGKIIARGLRGDELEAKLAEIFAADIQ